MKNTINNLSMRGKLITLVVPALLVIIYFAVASIALSTVRLGDMGQLRSLVQLADVGDPLIETLQKERGRSAVVLSSGSDRDAARQAGKELANQRRQTDTRLSEYRTRMTSLTQEASFGPAVSNSIQAMERDLNTLGRLRSNVDNRAINGRESGALYTQLITGLLDRIPLVISRSSDPELTRDINAYYALAEAAESAGKERAAGAALISSGDFDLPSIQKIAGFEGHQQAFIREAAAMLPPDSELLAALRDLPATPESRNLQEKRDTLFSSPSGMYALNSAEWFDITTKRLGNLNSLRKALLDSTSAIADQSLADARRDMFATSGIAGAAIVIVFALVLLMVSAINRQISSLLDGVRFAMDNKDLSQQIHVSSKDEVGTIGRAINELFGRFGSALKHIDNASVQLATATEETSSVASQNANQTRNQQQQIEQVAAATEEMSATSEQISENTQQVADAANTVMERSRAGEEVLQGSVRRIRSLASSVKDVNNISGMATQIAAASEQQVAVTRELAGNMEAVSEVAILTLTGSQEISEVTGEQARLARQLQDLANEFKVAAA